MAALAALAYWGSQAGGTVLEKVILAVAAPVAFAILWGLFAAPKAPRRLRDPWRLLFEAVVFTLAAVALIAAGEPGLAGVFLVITLVNALAVRAFGEPGA